MNIRRILLGLLTAFLLVLGVTSFTGGYGFFAAPKFEAQLALPAPTSSMPTVTQPKKPVEQLCNGKPGPVIYYANVTAAAQYNNFGTPLGSRLSPLDELRSPQPDIHQIGNTFWDRLCHDPLLTRAVVAAAFPFWSGLHNTFDWMAALNKLATLDWDTAELVYHTKTPTSWTMMMKRGLPNDPPTTYITRAHYAGWYLRITLDDGQKLFLRAGCGGQPSLDLRVREGTQAALAGIFPTY
jgi:hypothetical protein